jgi:hypothetical protein
LECKRLDARLLTQDAIPQIKLLERANSSKDEDAKPWAYGGPARAATGCQVAERIGADESRLLAARARGARGPDENSLCTGKEQSHA